MISKTDSTAPNNNSSVFSNINHTLTKDDMDVLLTQTAYNMTDDEVDMFFNLAAEHLAIPLKDSLVTNIL